MKKWLLLIIGIIIVAGGVYAYFQFKKEDQPAAPPVATTKVRKGTIEVSVSGTGSIQVGDRQSVTAGKQGTIKEVKIKENGLVKKGDVMLVLEGEDNSDQISSSEIDLEKKLLELTDLQDRYDAEEDEKNLSSLELSIKKQKLDIAQTRNNIAAMKEKQAEVSIVAPITGTVKSVAVVAGDSLTPQTQIAEIVDYANLKMVVSIDELDIPKVKLGQEAKISVEALTGESLSGKVTAIADEGTSNNGVATFDVTIALAKTDDVKVGMSAEASIEVEKKENTLMLPIDTVQSMGGRYIVLLPNKEEAAAAGGDAAGSKQTPQTDQSGTGGQGQQGQQPQGQRSRSNQSGEGAAAWQQMRQSGAAASGRNANRFAGGTPQQVEVGIHNEDYIEILSGLKEGDDVIVTTVVSGSNNSNMQQGFPGMGMGGMGGMGRSFIGGSGGGGFPGGASFQGNGGGRTGTRASTGTSGGGR
ncbi:efflux RND transporter periplasmic adaptor subunit [Paenibacillus sp. GCM10027626]|uniref:efflux RND transporter periplasmic adaptor subunit n=1 Tax=Paenibacillus sp. GCM10027626 TaxID=3273411 RepID=UPI00363E2660